MTVLIMILALGAASLQTPATAEDDPLDGCSRVKTARAHLVPSISHSFLSSKLVKEIYKFGGEINSMVPDIVDKKLKEKYSAQ